MVFNELDFDDGNTLTNPAVSGATLEYTHTYAATGTYTGNLEVANILSGGITSTCEIPTGVTITAAPVNGECNVIGSTYDDNEDGAEIANDDATLCAVGTATGYNYDSVSGWSWECKGLNGGTKETGCTAAVEYCGDGVMQGGEGEQCDDGNEVSGDGCNNTCQLEAITCNIEMEPDTGSGSLGTEYTLTTDSWITSGYIDLGNGDEPIPAFDGSTSYTGETTYNTVGIFTVTGYIDHPYNTGAIETCTTTVTVDSAVECGPADGEAFYSGSTFTDTQLCTNGTTGNNLTYDAGAKKWTWSCISDL